MKKMIDSGFNIVQLIEGREPLKLSVLDVDFLTDEVEYHIETGTEYNDRKLYAFVAKFDTLSVLDVTNKLNLIYSNFNKLPKVISSNEMILYFFSKAEIKSQVICKENNYSIELKGMCDYVKIDETVDLVSIVHSVNYANMVIDTLKELNNISLPSNEIDFSLDEVKEKVVNLGSEFSNDLAKWDLLVQAVGNRFINTVDNDEALNFLTTYTLQNPNFTMNMLFTRWSALGREKTSYTLSDLFKNIKEVSDYDKFNKFLTSSPVVDIDSLKANIRKYKLKDYELDLSLDNVQCALERSSGKKVATSVIRKIFKEIEREADKEIGELAIGLDNELANIILKNKFNGGRHFINVNGNIFFYNDGCWRMSDLPFLQKQVLHGIREVLFSSDPKYDAIKSVIHLKKMNDSIDSLTNTITNLILKDSAEPEYKDTLNLRGTRELPHSVINTLNKEIYINKGVITTKNHSFDSYLTTQFNVVYDEKADCPNWDKMLDRIFNNYADKEDIIRHFYEIIGYSIQNKKETPLVCIFLGPGKNGKTYVLREIAKLLGIDSVVTTNICKFFEQPHATTTLLGKLWLIDDDWKKGQLLPDDQLKSLSESKMITANPKGKSTFNFMSNVTPFINSNSSPRTKDTSEGMVRRVQVFEFNREITESEKDPYLSEKLARERSGFLNKLIQGYIRYVNRGCRFELPYSIQRSNREWFKASNPLVAYLDEKYIFTGNQNDRIKLQSMFDNYKNYLENENQSNHSITRNNFKDELKNMGSSRNISVVKNSHDTTYYVHGVKAKGFNTIEPAKLPQDIYNRMVDKFQEDRLNSENK